MGQQCYCKYAWQMECLINASQAMRMRSNLHTKDRAQIVYTIVNIESIVCFITLVIV